MSGKSCSCWQLLRGGCGTRMMGILLIGENIFRLNLKVYLALGAQAARPSWLFLHYCVPAELSRLPFPVPVTLQCCHCGGPSFPACVRKWGIYQHSQCSYVLSALFSKNLKMSYDFSNSFSLRVATLHPRKSSFVSSVGGDTTPIEQG